MAYYTSGYLLTEANINAAVSGKPLDEAIKYDAKLIKEAAIGDEIYDVFLSHSYQEEKALIWQLRNEIEETLGLKVYIDWIDDPQLDRTNINFKTAYQLRHRMNHCRSLIVATSKISTKSKWIPWELGYMDGFTRSKIAILPITNIDNETFSGQEYFGIYPIVETSQPLLMNFNGKFIPIVRTRQNHLIQLDDFIRR